jgi:glutathione S-transferase
MLTLYYIPNAICAQKVRLALAEKAIEFESRSVAGLLRDPGYLRLNPNGVVPTLDHDGRILIESRIISEYLEDAFPENALLPRDAYERYRARYWSKQSDDTLHLSVFTLSFVSYMREHFIVMPKERRERALPGLNDPIKRRHTLQLLDAGYESPLVREALQRFGALLDEMQTSLASSGQWLAGSSYSLADADITPYLHRLTALGLDSMWSQHAAVVDWFHRVRARPSYRSEILGAVTPSDQQTDDAVRAKARPEFERLLSPYLDGQKDRVLRAGEAS